MECIRIGPHTNSARRSGGRCRDLACDREFPGLESRHYLQAWHFLRQIGHQPPASVARQVLGVVVEVGMPKGLDLLAAYPNYSARYYNYSGKSVIWEHPDDSLNEPIDVLLAIAAKVVAETGPWDQERPPATPIGQARVCFLTPCGMHFGQGLLDILYKDPLGAPVLHQAGKLMEALIAKTTPSPRSN